MPRESGAFALWRSIRHRKVRRVEPKDEIKRRIDDAAKFVSLEQLCLSPQCSFASTEEAVVLAIELQRARLRTIVELANEVWG